MLAAAGGRYEWSVLPCVIASAALFLASGARVASDSSSRPIDLVLIAALGIIVLQMLPLPPALLDAVSPAARRLQDAYALDPSSGWRSLSIHPATTRLSFALAVGAALVFWAAREAFARGGTRAAIRLLAWVGFACSLVSLAQRATAPATLYWLWTIPDPRAKPFGPFVDRNQLATWLVLTISVVAGYLVMRTRGHMHARAVHGWRASIVALSDGEAIGILGCLGAMLITLAATQSRSGFIALVVSATVGATLAHGDRRQGLRLGAAAAVGVLAVAAWLNIEGLIQRAQSTLDSAAGGRVPIWRETVHLIRDFPLVGTGAGTFAEAMFIYQRTATQVLFNHAHDEYLQILTEGGVTLLLVVVAGLVLLVRTARARLAHDDGPSRFVRIGACAALAAIGVQSIWETGLRSPANLLLAAILAAIAVRPLDRRESEEMPAA